MTFLGGAPSNFIVDAVPEVRLAGGDIDWPNVGCPINRVRGLRGVCRVAVVTLVIYALCTVLVSLFSVSSDTSWFVALGRGQGTILGVAVPILVGLGFKGVSRADGVGALLGPLAVGSVPGAIPTILQRFGLD